MVAATGRRPRQSQRFRSGAAAKVEGGVQGTHCKADLQIHMISCCKLKRHNVFVSRPPLELYSRALNTVQQYAFGPRLKNEPTLAASCHKVPSLFGRQATRPHSRGNMFCFIQKHILINQHKQTNKLTNHKTNRSFVLC